MTDLEYEVIKSLQQHEVITKNVENQLDQNWTLGERLADKIATFGGSWAFLMCFATFLAIWIIVNTVVMVTHPADPYPFILLNFSVHDKFHRTLILSGFCLLKIAKISLNSSFFPKPIKR